MKSIFELQYTVYSARYSRICHALVVRLVAPSGSIGEGRASPTAPTDMDYFIFTQYLLNDPVVN